MHTISAPAIAARISRALLVGVLTVLSATQAYAATTVVASVLPNSRSVQVGTPATLFASVLNAGTETGANCRIEPDASINGEFEFQATDPATNQPIGSPNAPVTLGPGGLQTFLVVLTANAVQAPTEVALRFLCDNASAAGTIIGVNTFTFSASTPPVPDVIALGATPTANGVVELPDVSRINVFSVASVNLGSADTLQVTARLSDASLPAAVALCETDPATSVCINPTVPTTGAVTTSVANQATPTFGIFITGMGSVPFDPATNRVFVRFEDGAGAIRGSTSVALRTELIVPFTTGDVVGTTLWADPTPVDRLPGISAGVVFSSGGTGVSYENSLGFRSGQAYSDVGQSFTWTIDQGRLVQNFNSFVTTKVVPIFGDYTALVATYGMPQSVADFFAQLWDAGQIGTELELERQVIRRTTRIRAANGGQLEVTAVTLERYTMDAELTRRNWSGELPEGTAGETAVAQQLTSPAALSQAAGQVAAAGETWAIPFVFAPQDAVVADQPAAYVVDVLTLQGNGTTDTGRLSAEAFSWRNEGTTLVLEAGNEAHRYKSLRAVGGARLALAEYYIDGALSFVSGQLIAKADATGSDLTGALIDADPHIWQAGLNIWPQQAYRADGLLLPEFVFGYQFLDGATASRVTGYAAADLSCPGSVVGCFTKEGAPLWSWSAAGNLIERQRDSDGTLRRRNWEVLSYVPGGRAVVLESAVWQTNGGAPRFVIPPRINTLERLDLSVWSAEYVNSPDF